VRDIFRHLNNVTQIRVQVFVKGGRHGDDHHIHVRKAIHINGGLKLMTLYHILQFCIINITDEVFSTIDHSNPMVIQVKSDHAKTRFGLFHREWKPYVSHADDPNSGIMRFDFLDYHIDLIYCLRIHQHSYLRILIHPTLQSHSDLQIKPPAQNRIPSLRSGSHSLIQEHGNA